MIHRRRFRFGNIKVRQLGVCFFFSFIFLFLVFTHGPPDTPPDIGNPLPVEPSYNQRLRKPASRQHYGSKSHVKSHHGVTKDEREEENSFNPLGDNKVKSHLDETNVLGAKGLEVHDSLPLGFDKHGTIDKFIKFQDSAKTTNKQSIIKNNETVKHSKFKSPNIFGDELIERVELLRLSQIDPIKGDVRSETSNNHSKHHRESTNTNNSKYGERMVHYKASEPLIWVTGHPRSGTTLMRAMLDAHQDIRCGAETHIIPRVLGGHGTMVNNHLEMGRLNEANVNEDVIANALGAYIMTVIAQHGEPAKRLCNKDPMTILSSQMIKYIFPNSKFIFMIRDGRAVVHSVLTRKVGITGFDRRSHKGALRSWNLITTKMLHACQELGPQVCLPVYYEQLVLHPKQQMTAVLKFLDIEWDDVVLRHHETIGKKGGVALSKKEFSTDQVEKPINLISLTSWVKDFPEDVKPSVREVAPLLEILGYDADGYPPDYGTPDSLVLENTRKLESNKQVKVG